MNADALPVVRGKTRQREIVQVDEAGEQVAAGIDLHRQPALREIDLHLVRALLQAAAHLGLVLAQQVVDELFARVAFDARLRDTSGSSQRAK